MKKKRFFFVLIPLFFLIISPSIYKVKADPNPANSSYCYVTFTEADNCNPWLDVYWIGELDDGWWTSSYYKDDFGPYYVNANGYANCLLSYLFVHLKCKAVLWDWNSSDPPSYTMFSDWTGQSGGSATVSSYIDFDDDWPFPIL